MKFTHQRLLEARARANAATDGPWEATDNGCVTASAALMANPSAYVVASVGWHDTRTPLDVDTKFIAASRTDVPDLLDDVAELQHNLVQVMQEREAFRVHSIKLNEIGWRIATALGKVPKNTPQVLANLDELLDELLGYVVGTKARAERDDPECGCYHRMSDHRPGPDRSPCVKCSCTNFHHKLELPGT